MTDSRLKQAEVLIDDARNLLADMAEEGFGGDQLAAARMSLNVSLKHLQILQDVKTQCPASPLGGGQCVLPAGHDGRHRKVSYPNGPDKPAFIFEWTNESQTRLADKHGSRFD